MKDSIVNSFICLLLNKNAETRLGGSFSNLKKNPIFAQVEWHELINKKIKPAFEIPK